MNKVIRRRIRGFIVRWSITCWLAAATPALYGAQPHYDHASFLAGSASTQVIDFENLVEPGGFAFLGDPGVYVGAGLQITSNSPMFIQNNNAYGTGSFLSPQQSNPEMVHFTLPYNADALGFFYFSSSNSTITLSNGEAFDVPATTSLSFFGFTSDTPVAHATLTVDGPGIDLDNVHVNGESRVPFTGGGTIDTSFAAAGVLSIETLTTGTGASFEGVAEQPSGRIVLAGVVHNAEDPVHLEAVRIHPNGTPDATFGDNGHALIGPSGTSDRSLNDAFATVDGTLVFAGGVGPFNGDRASYAASYDYNGAPRSGFGTDGVAVQNLFDGGFDEFERIAQQADGKLLFGSRYDGMYRYLPNGTPDLAFGANGRGALYGAWSSYGIHPKANGKIITVGAPSFSNSVAQEFIFVRYLSGGDTDSDFGPLGEVEIFASNGNDNILDLQVDDRGRIYGMGYMRPPGGSLQAVIVRLLPTGWLDPVYGNGGILTLQPGDDYLPKGIKLRPDGGLLVVGHAPPNEIVLGSYTESGQLDSTFADSGWARLDLTATPIPLFIGPDRWALETLSTGGILVNALTCGCVVKFSAPEWLDTDGDGLSNGSDPDDDNDGVPDAEDALPLLADESVDTDNDGWGNNADPDDDADGVPDTSDAFPLNPAESVDTDGDGIGNNQDTDDDGDGLSDEDELLVHGTNPLAADTDRDGLPDGQELELGLDPLDSSDCPEALCPSSTSAVMKLILSLDADAP